MKVNKSCETFCNKNSMIIILNLLDKCMKLDASPERGVTQILEYTDVRLKISTTTR